MTLNKKFRLANKLCKTTNGVLVSTPLQLANETFIFKFPKANPDKKYGIYKSGWVRCIMPGSPYSGGRDYMTPLHFRTYAGGRKEAYKVSFAAGIEYLQKRFG